MRWRFTLPALMSLFIAACVSQEECNMRDCAKHRFGYGLFQSTAYGASFDRSDTLRAGVESAFFLYIENGGMSASAASSDCDACNSLLAGEKLVSDAAVIAGNDTLPAGIDLLDSSVVDRWASGAKGTILFHPGVRFRRGMNRVIYKGRLQLGRETLLTIQDTARFWVDSAAGY